MQMKNYNLVRKNKRLHEKCSNLKHIVSELQKKKYLSIEQFNELDLQAEDVKFTNRLVQKSKFKGYLCEYTTALRKFAVTLHYYSVDAYKYVRQVFIRSLPHPRVIGKWYKNSSGDPGFNKQALDILEKKCNNDGKRILCTLIADQMTLRHQTTWDGTKTAGVVDFGAGSAKSCEIATQAYVFTLVCMNESWKIPVAYFLVNGLSAETRTNLLKTCLTECYSVGVDIVTIVFNGCAANINAANLLGCDLKHPSRLKTTFKHPECDLEVAIMLDACHLIKLVRNSFEAKRLIFDESGNRIRWQLLNNLVKFQKNVGLNFANKISVRHIHFRNEVMKVKLATQIMSMRVANALRLCNEVVTSSLFKDTDGTIDFLTIFNNLFDILNSKSSDVYGLKKPLSTENADEVLQYLEKARQYILGLDIFVKYRSEFRQRITMKVMKRKIVESKNKTGFLGFLICIESLKHLYSTLVEKQHLQYISTYKLSENNLQMIFNAFRRFGNYNNNPSALQFKSIFKKIFQRLEMKSSFLGKCIPLEDIPTLMCSSAIENINSTVSKRAVNDELDSVNTNWEQDNKRILETDHIIDANVEAFSEILNTENVKETTEQIIGYISAWVSRKLVNKLKCEICTDSLISNDKLWFHKLIILKNMGGLCFPSTDVFKICLKSEAVIKNQIKATDHIILSDIKDIQIIKYRILKSFVSCNDVFESLNSHSIEQHPIFNHRLHLIRAVINKFIGVRLHFAHKTYIDCKTDYKRQKRNKLTLFEGL
ncbi:hypothetical protein O3G_MSEX007396 [Manduca sexta]|nr:hypothetical protein O3G_MSEX007396 [Manduca sexta]